MKRRMDSKKIADSFHRQAEAYDSNVLVQNRVIAKLVQDAKFQADVQSGMILDIGCGTGTLLEQLRSVFPNTGLIGLDLALNMCRQTARKLQTGCRLVNGNAENLPFSDATFELVVSSSVMQWVNDISKAISDAARVLRGGGLLRFSLFVDGTLCELQQCFREADMLLYGVGSERLTRMHRFHTSEQIMEIFNGMDAFEDIRFAFDTEIDLYPSVKELLRSVKEIGAGAQSGSSKAGLAWRSILQKMTDVYLSRFGRDGGIPASYRVMHISARRSANPWRR